MPAVRLAVLVPNLLSLSRVALGLAFPWAPPRARVGLIVAAALTDLLDGLVCRWWHVATPLGRILDPVADKVFVLLVLLTFWCEGTLHAAEAALVGLRDLAVLAGVGWLVLRGNWSALHSLPPSLPGKLATGAQFVFLLSLALWRQPVLVVFLPTVLLSGLAAADYLHAFLANTTPTTRRDAPP
jgi:phosphatidylglycerophosphate synthase